MNEKSKNITDYIIAGRKIEVVTELSLEECQHRLQQMTTREHMPFKINISINRLKVDLLQFEITYGSWMQKTKMVGEMRYTSDHQTVISAEVLLQDRRILYAIITMLVAIEALVVVFALVAQTGFSIVTLVLFALPIPFVVWGAFDHAKTAETLLLHTVKAMFRSSPKDIVTDEFVLRHTYSIWNGFYMEVGIPLYETEYHLYRFLISIGGWGKTTDIAENKLEFKIERTWGRNTHTLKGTMTWDENTGLTAITCEGKRNLYDELLRFFEEFARAKKKRDSNNQPEL